LNASAHTLHFTRKNRHCANNFAPVTCTTQRSPDSRGSRVNALHLYACEV